MIASCGILEDELRQCSKEEGVTVADSVEKRRLENESKEVASKIKKREGRSVK